MVCALGLGDQLVGITHECDYPPEVKGKPIVVRNALPIERMSQREIASKTNTPLGTVKTRLELGLKKIYDGLKDLRDEL